MQMILRCRSKRSILWTAIPLPARNDLMLCVTIFRKSVGASSQIAMAAVIGDRVVG